MGWTPDQLDDMPLHRLEVAREGRIEMLKAIFGGPDRPRGTARGADGRSIKLTPKAFDAVFGAGRTTGTKRRTN